MSAGRMRDIVTFRRKTGTKDAYGNTVQTWVDLFTESAEVMETLGREVVASGRLGEQATARMKVYRSPRTEALTSADAVFCRGEIWNIRSRARLESDLNRLELLIERGVAP